MKKKIAVLVLMLAAAVFLLVFLSLVNKSVKIRKLGVTTEGSVLQSFSTSTHHGLHNVTVSFNTPDGRQVTGTASTLRSFYSGDKVKIWYDPASPQKIDFGDTIGYNMRGVIVGGFLFIFGLFFFIRFSLSDSANNRLIRSGQKIQAEFVSVDRDERFRAGDKNPWIIKCKWTDNSNNQEYFFVSKEYTIDPAPYLNGRYHIDVFIDPADPGKYFMDTSFMPKGNNTIG
jgi:hypothetical protein